MCPLDSNLVLFRDDDRTCGSCSGEKIVQREHAAEVFRAAVGALFLTFLL